MAERYRRPLAEASANTPSLVQRPTKTNKITVPSPSPVSSPLHLPHNLSLEPNGSLNTRSQPTSPEHNRLNKVANSEDWKRNSAISTTSTNASSRQRKAHIGHWQLGRTIGKGGCSRVRAVRHRYTQQIAAVKIITRSTAENTRAQSLAHLHEKARTNHMVSASGYKPIPTGLEREIVLMKLLEHDNIVKLFDVWENRNELYLIMEFVDGGELFHYVEQRRGLAEDETVVIFRQIVAALLYCHRLHICHRDLKPENILLNQARLQVKLIDFGMAALQPQGKLLSTPCGSPHYAAPEVVSAKPYDGKAADAWSCGVILYVMLTGTTPFNYSREGDIRALFADITKAKYHMPPGLSVEAQDLIRRIFVANPKHRISMDGIWDHPLLHKYDKRLGLVGPIGSKEVAIGPVPKLADWTIRRAEDIDPVILHNMHTLWHSEDERDLVQKLLSREVNQEKLFYAALIKHQDQNIETFIGHEQGLAYSASDHHHSGSKNAASLLPVPLNKEHRTSSQYSILNDEHLRNSHSLIKVPPSVSSYDPYRASRQPVIDTNQGANFAVVHRNGSVSTTARSSVQQTRSIRSNAMRNRGMYNLSSSSLPRSAYSKASLRRSSTSKHSLGTSNWPSSPPVVSSARPVSMHKRGVVFNHVRRTSTTSNLTPNAAVKGSKSTSRDVAKAPKTSKRNDSLDSIPDSPAAFVNQAIRSRKNVGFETPQIRVRPPSSNSQVINREVRQHSKYLESFCDQAFYTSSDGSDITQSPLTEQSSVTQTPASSVSTQISTMAEAQPKRPLPDVPLVTRGGHLQANASHDVRAKLIALKASGNPHMDEIIRMFDEYEAANQWPERRLLSVPESRMLDSSESMLPSISEESNSETRSAKHRSVTAPVMGSRDRDETIRMVPASPVTPLKIRKSHGGQDNAGSKRGSAIPQVSHLRRQRSQNVTEVLEVIDENEALPAGQSLHHKKSWFGIGRRSQSQPTSTDQGKRASLKASEQYDGEANQEGAASVASSEFPIRQRRLQEAKKGIAKWLGKRVAHRSVVDQVHGETSLTTQSTHSLFSTSSTSTSLSNVPSVTGQSRSWFARFLRPRPKTKLLCFCISRERATEELIILFKEWQRHGIRDLKYSRSKQTISARVDKQNALDIKPVLFRVELFVVLDNGHQVDLAIARFTQVKGAVNAFRKVLDVVDGVMRSREWLVQDQIKWKAMCEAVEGQ